MKLTAKAISAVRFPGCSSRHLQGKVKEVNAGINQCRRHPDTIKTEHCVTATWFLWHYTSNKEPRSAALLQHSLSEGTDGQKLLFILRLGGSQILPGLGKTQMYSQTYRGKKSANKPQIQIKSSILSCIVIECNQIYQSIHISHRWKFLSKDRQMSWHIGPQRQ